MANITGILCQVITGTGNGAGTDGDVYLGICGREFHLDSSADDFERGSLREYIMGRAPLEPNLPSPQIRVNNSVLNDPRTDYIMKTETLPSMPVYIRFEPNGDNDHWQLHFAAVLVYTGRGDFNTAYIPPQDFDNLWLGYRSGKILYLQELPDVTGDHALERGREKAKTLGISAE